MAIKLIPIVAFGLFVLCPRMAGMAQVIARHAEVNLVWTVALGAILSVPSVIVMAPVFRSGDYCLH